MVFKSDKQRKKVMALMRGGTKSSVQPEIISAKFQKIQKQKKFKEMFKDRALFSDRLLRIYASNSARPFILPSARAAAKIELQARTFQKHIQKINRQIIKSSTPD